jgi:uncharacterized protein YgiM (DUF1202 family)
MTARTDALLSLAAALALTAAAPRSAMAQSMPALPAPGAAPAALPAPGAAAPAAAPEETKPFVGVITGDKVYIRSGPGNAYYEMGQLAKGDLVQVTEARLGWYKILPPNGTFCMIAKDFVDVDASGQNGTLKGDFVNVRAGTALYPNREPSAVLATLRKGAKLTILGSTDKYYQIAPPDNARVYISPQFVAKASDDTAYKVPNLKLPAGATGPSRDTVTAPTTLPAATVVDVAPAHPQQDTAPPANNTDAGTVVINPATQPAGNTTVVNTGDNLTGNPPSTQPSVATVPPQPATQFSATASAAFQELNTKYQAELRKPPLQRDLDPLLKSYRDLLNEKDLAPSVKIGSESRVAALEKLAAIQRLAKENQSSTDTLSQQRQALQQEYAAAAKAIEDYEKTGPYLAEGTLQASAAVQGKYALVNPATGRVVAYVDPAADVDIGSLVGKYIGVRGTTDTAPGTSVTVLHVRNATLLPPPGPATPAPSNR